MNILLLGSGGREHALAWKMAASPLTDRLYCAPGNARHRAGGAVLRARHCRSRRGGRLLPRQRHRFRRRRAGGAAVRRDRRRLESAGIKSFGPSRAAARLEGSKGFTKDLCRANGIPTAAYERFRAADPAKAYIALAARRSSSRPTGLPPAKVSSWRRASLRQKRPST